MFIDHPLLVKKAKKNAVATNPRDHPKDVVDHRSRYISAVCSVKYPSEKYKMTNSEFCFISLYKRERNNDH